VSAAATGIRRSVALPRVTEAIQIFGVRFFNQLALTVAQSCIAFAAAGGDAPTRSMQAKRVTGAVSNQRRLAVTHLHWDMIARAVTQYTVLKGFVVMK
jgi:hypothetical protein